jgi:hypothetical protein
MVSAEANVIIVELPEGNVIVFPSVPAKVREFEKVMVLPSVPANVRVLETVAVLPSATASVEPLAGAVMAILLIEVAVATPRTGVASVGVFARTGAPVPVGVAHV